MEIIDTFRKALKRQIHNVIFIFPSKKFRTLWLSQNCLSTLQFSFRHTFPPPQLRRVFFPAPSKGTGSLGRDFASQISSSLGSGEESRGLTQARRRLRCLFTARLAKAACPCPGCAPGMLPGPRAQRCFSRSRHEAGSSATASAAATSLPRHR